MASSLSPAGIYLHVPFCLSKCRYCDFYSITDRSQISDYLTALGQEITMVGMNCPPADTVYFGGGTPSLLPADALGRIIEQTASRFDICTDTEITLEMNPATLDAADFHDLRATGINRLNLGCQSFNSNNLAFLGRIHSPVQAMEAFAAARSAGFDNIGIDLIYGLPGQTPDMWEKDLLQGIALAPEHISGYILSYEPGTPLYDARHSGAFPKLSDEQTTDLFRQTHRILETSGYEHYEISNFAKDGFRSRHNQKYWTFKPYIGFGPAAHSYIHPMRWWNHRSLESYCERLAQGQYPMGEKENLTHEQEMIEMLYLGLRQSDGLAIGTLGRHRDQPAFSRIQNALRDMEKQGLARIENQRWRLTLEGMLLLDHLVGELTNFLDDQE